MLIGSSDLATAFIFGYILFGLVIPVAPAMLTAWACVHIMSRITMKEAMLTGVATSAAAFFAWLFYSNSNGFYAWLVFPPAACVAMAAISMIATFAMCYWLHNRKISPADEQDRRRRESLSRKRSGKP